MVRVLVIASALGEMAVGLAAVVLPGAVMSLLLGAPVAGMGVVAARMAGIAVAAMGAAWWIDRQRLDGARVRELAPSFIGYNAGVGLLFLAHAWAADRTLVVAWAVAAAHLAAAVGYAMALAMPPRTTRT